jgi:hypothetical protein
MPASLNGLVHFLNTSLGFSPEDKEVEEYYKLLYKSCTSCSFSVYATGASNSGDVVTFSNITIQDGFYAIATTDTNL